MVDNIVNLRTIAVDVETWLKDSNNIYIGRPSKWGNPFRISVENSREEAVKKFESYVLGNPELLKNIAELRGKSLGCWCYPELCHGNILKKLVGARMVLTKGEQGQLNDLKDQYSELKKLVEDVGVSVRGIASQLTTMNTDLTTRIDGVETKLSNDMQRLEANLNSEVQSLKQENTEIREMVDANKQTALNVIGSLRGDVLRCNESRNHELKAANDLISTLSTKVVRLEKQCHRGVQHGRGWNIEVDGIPKEVGDEPTNLKKAMSELSDVFNINVENNEIEAIHRLPSRHDPKPVIIRFFSRESVKEIHQKKVAYGTLLNG